MAMSATPPGMEANHAVAMSTRARFASSGASAAPIARVTKAASSSRPALAASTAAVSGVKYDPSAMPMMPRKKLRIFGLASAGNPARRAPATATSAPISQGNGR